MQAKINLPSAFSVRDENEFYPIQHLVARLNPEAGGSSRRDGADM